LCNGNAAASSAPFGLAAVIDKVADAVEKKATNAVVAKVAGSGVVGSVVTQALNKGSSVVSAVKKKK